MSAATPWLSVVIPVRGRADLLRVAVASVLGQEGVDPDFELLVVDNGSDPPAADALAQVTDPRLRVLRLDVNRERGAARNAGVAAARGPLVAFLDSDDAWLPDKLARQRPGLPDGGGSVTAAALMDDGGHETGELRTPPADALARIAQGNPILGGASSLVVDRAQLQAAGGFPEELAVQGAEDWIMFARLARAGVPLRIEAWPGVRYRVHVGNSVADPAWLGAAVWEAIALMEREGLLSGPEAERSRQVNATMIARQFAHRGRHRDAVAWTRRAWRHGSVAGAVRGTALVAGSALAPAVRRRGGRGQLRAASRS